MRLRGEKVDSVIQGNDSRKDSVMGDFVWDRTLNLSSTVTFLIMGTIFLLSPGAAENPERVCFFVAAFFFVLTLIGIVRGGK